MQMNIRSIGFAKMIQKTFALVSCEAIDKFDFEGVSRVQEKGGSRYFPVVGHTVESYGNVLDPRYWYF